MLDVLASCTLTRLCMATTAHAACMAAEPGQSIAGTSGKHQWLPASALCICGLQKLCLQPQSTSQPTARQLVPALDLRQRTLVIVVAFLPAASHFLCRGKMTTSGCLGPSLSCSRTRPSDFTAVCRGHTGSMICTSSRPRSGTVHGEWQKLTGCKTCHIYDHWRQASGMQDVPQPCREANSRAAACICPRGCHCCHHHSKQMRQQASMPQGAAACSTSTTPGLQPVCSHLFIESPQLLPVLQRGGLAGALPQNEVLQRLQLETPPEDALQAKCASNVNRLQTQTDHHKRCRKAIVHSISAIIQPSGLQQA